MRTRSCSIPPDGSSTDALSPVPPMSMARVLGPEEGGTWATMPRDYCSGLERGPSGTHIALDVTGRLGKEYGCRATAVAEKGGRLELSGCESQSPGEGRPRQPRSGRPG